MMSVIGPNGIVEGILFWAVVLVVMTAVLRVGFKGVDRLIARREEVNERRATALASARRPPLEPRAVEAVGAERDLMGLPEELAA